MTPLCLPSPLGPLFAVYFPPYNRRIERAIVHIPAFAEEMNKSRRMVALQARDFAQQGYAVLVLDLFGTGDSAGEFGEASWEYWLQNVDTAVGWLKRQGAQRIGLWGLRTGSLLAIDYACHRQQQLDYLLCWQPVLNGDTFVTQFLRLRIAAAIMDGNAPKEKTSDLKQRLTGGQGLEVAGYWLNPDLINPIMALRADRMNWENGPFAVDIFEVVADESSQVSVANHQWLSILRERRIDASLTKVVGAAFWASQEITETPALIGASTERLSLLDARVTETAQSNQSS